MCFFIKSEQFFRSVITPVITRFLTTCVVLIYPVPIAPKPEGLPQPRPELAYRLYAALLDQSPAAFAASTHEDAVMPMSQFLALCSQNELLWKVNLLGERSEAALSDVLKILEALELERGGRVLVTERS